MSNELIAWSYKQAGLRASEKAVLAFLADRANDEGRSWPFIRTIAEAVSLTAQTVKKALKSLREKGLVSWSERRMERDRNTSNLYTIHRTRQAPPEVADLSTGDRSEDPDLGEPIYPSGVYETPQRNPQKEPSGETYVRREKKPVDKFDLRGKRRVVALERAQEAVTHLLLPDNEAENVLAWLENSGLSVDDGRAAFAEILRGSPSAWSRLRRVAADWVASL